MLLNRRQFGKAALRSLVVATVGAGASTATSANPHPVLTFTRLGLDFGSPDDVAAKFVRSDSASLMASYAVFFPELLRRNGVGAVEALRSAAQRQAKKYRHDHHRLDALPPVAAAHLMPVTTDPDKRHYLSETILCGLEDPRREVREIILQNLVSSIAPNFDSVRYFSLERELISKLQETIEEACENEKLLIPALHCAEFLLGSRSLLNARGASNDELGGYDEAIAFIQTVNAPHMWYLPYLVKLHEDTFKASQREITSLPPQSSEALMGWQRSPRARRYLALLALSRARVMYTALQTCSKMSEDSCMSSEEAKRALPKMITFFKAFELQTLVDCLPPPEKMLEAEPAFARFLNLEFNELLRSPHKFGISLAGAEISEDMINLRELVPFAQFEDRALVCRRMGDDNSRILGTLVGVGATVVGIKIALPLITSILNNEGVQTEAATVEQLCAEVDTREKAIDAGEYKGLDEQQAALGNIDLRAL
jgi:hypothetical protein